MKRGKDEEKSMGPMFPRLHVNDTEKGGPRAPPRNKMALYEQLSIPSQRFNSGVNVMPLNPTNPINNLVPPPSSSQASGNERGAFFQPQLPPAEKVVHTRYADLNTPLVRQLEQKKKPDEDNDFSVPIFVQSGMGQDNTNKNSNSMDRQRLSPFTPTYSITKLQKSNGEEPKRTETTGPHLRKQTNPLSPYECTIRTTNSFSRSQNTGDSLQRQYRAGSQAGNTIVGGGVANEFIRGVDYRNSSVPVRDLQSEEQRSPNDTNSDDVSETSMLDSISGIDISPDDVVGIIGQKHFWKARKAIVNQQRVFAVQVFELHRLMKVQRLIAGSPHLLLEDGAYLGKPLKAAPPHLLLEDGAYLGKPLKAAPAKKLPLEYIVKAPPKIPEQVVSEKPNDTIECSAENAIGKASLSSVQNGSQPSNYGPFSSNPPTTPASNDSSKMGSWGFNQPPGHQWLIPVMSPSEGLVYKPYPSPGFMGAVCGGYGPHGPTPVMGNFLNYGVPPPTHFQGLGLTPFTPPPGHGYFPPFGMPVMNPPASASVSEQGLNRQLSGGGSTFNAPYQGSCNVPSQKNREVSKPVKPHASRDSELQFSSASSPCERQGGVAAPPHVSGGAATDGRNAAAQVGGAATDGRDALTLFPTSPAALVPDGGGPQPREADQAARVIRVVPHNARSATESVARIFQSIQEERKQYDSV